MEILNPAVDLLLLMRILLMEKAVISILTCMTAILFQALRESPTVEISGDIDGFTKEVWESLNEENKVSLFVRFIDIETGKYETRIVNKNQ